jgi:hypothetical protein
VGFPVDAIVALLVSVVSAVVCVTVSVRGFIAGVPVMLDPVTGISMGSEHDIVVPWPKEAR